MVGKGFQLVQGLTFFINFDINSRKPNPWHLNDIKYEEIYFLLFFSHKYANPCYVTYVRDKFLHQYYSQSAWNVVS